MMKLSLCLSLITLSASVAVALPAVRENLAQPAVASLIVPQYIPGSYIIQFENASAMKKRTADGNHTKSFLSDLQSTLKADVIPIKTFDSQIFEGVAVTVQGHSQNPDDELQLIQSLPGVKAVSRDRIITTADDDEISAIGNDALKSRPKWSTHTKTGVSSLHENGIKGAGATVCIIDSGIDTTHPAFAGGRYKGGNDVTSDNLSGEPLECAESGHGTHVAGIAAGSDSKFVGVAPEANIRAYKVFACQTNGRIKTAKDSHVLKALELAAKDKCDVVNISIGFYGEPSRVITEAMEMLKLHGILVVVSAGNEGDHGPFYANGFASPKSVLAVGSYEHDQDVKYTATAIDASDNEIDIPIQQHVGSGFGPIHSLPVIHYQNPCEQNKGHIMNNEDRRFKFVDKLALIPYGKCDDKIVAIEIKSQGGNDILFYTPDDETTAVNPLSSPNVVDGGMNWGIITQSNARKILAMKNAKISFDPVDQVPEGHDAQSTAAGHMAVSSTWGPTNDMRMKPDIAAPGGMIFSAWPKKIGTYAVISGTSMAAPYVAGIAALAIAEDKKKKDFEKDVEYVTNLKNRIIASGQFVNWYDGNKVSETLFAPTAQQGNGAVNAITALNPTALVNLPVLTMSTTPQTQKFIVTIDNPTNEEQTYTLCHIPAVTFDTFSSSLLNGVSDLIPKFPPSINAKAVANVRFSTDTITVARGQTADVNIRITPPPLSNGLSAKQVPIYSGKITITPSKSPSYVSIPYIGTTSSLSSNISPILPKSVKFTNGKTSKTLKKNDEFPQVDYTEFSPDDQILIEFNVGFSTKEVDIFLETTGNPTRRVDITWHGGGIRKGRDSPADPDKERKEHPNKISWKGQDEGMLPVAVGEYRMVLRALKPTGDVKKEGDWQVFRSPIFEVVMP